MNSYLNVTLFYVSVPQLAPTMIGLFDRQVEFVGKLKSLTVQLKSSGQDRAGQIALAHRIISESLLSFEPVRLPLRPELEVVGISRSLKISSRSFFFPFFLLLLRPPPPPPPPRHRSFALFFLSVNH